MSSLYINDADMRQTLALVDDVRRFECPCGTPGCATALYVGWLKPGVFAVFRGGTTASIERGAVVFAYNAPAPNPRLAMASSIEGVERFITSLAAALTAPRSEDTRFLAEMETYAKKLIEEHTT